MGKNKFISFVHSYMWVLLVVFLVLGWFYPAFGVLAMVCMSIPLIEAVLRGSKKWCGTYCPRGSFNDIVLAKFSRRGKLPAILRTTLVKAALFAFLMVNLLKGLYGAETIGEAGSVFIVLVSLTTAFGIFLGVFYHQRAWCMICPMGFLSTLLMKGRRFVLNSLKLTPEQDCS